MAVTGKPFPMPLPMAMTSGTTPSWSTANQAPVRPKPVATSSATSRAPDACASFWRAVR